MLYFLGLTDLPLAAASFVHLHFWSWLLRGGDCIGNRPGCERSLTAIFGMFRPDWDRLAGMFSTACEPETSTLSCSTCAVRRCSIKAMFLEPSICRMARSSTASCRVTRRVQYLKSIALVRIATVHRRAPFDLQDCGQTGQTDDRRSHRLAGRGIQPAGLTHNRL